jgi:hypothetical protein
MVSLFMLWFHFSVKPFETLCHRIIIINCFQKPHAAIGGVWFFFSAKAKAHSYSLNCRLKQPNHPLQPSVA